MPQQVGAGSPIRHIIYIIKENRTYDQVFGEYRKGNGDARLAIFGKKVTPNQHKIAEQFVLLDNLYCDGEVSVDGHSWSNSAIRDGFQREAVATAIRRHQHGHERTGQHSVVRAHVGPSRARRA